MITNKSAMLKKRGIQSTTLQISYNGREKQNQKKNSKTYSSLQYLPPTGTQSLTPEMYPKRPLDEVVECQYLVLVLIKQ